MYDKPIDKKLHLCTAAPHLALTKLCQNYA